jgi:hypothetical protein
MTLVSNRESIEVVRNTYGLTPDFIGPVDQHPIRIHFQEIDGVVYVTPEGSRTLQDWKDNVMAWARVDYPKVAHGAALIPEGFYVSSASALNAVAERVDGKPYAFACHSRGAAQGAVLAKFLIDAGRPPPLKLYLIEPARAFFGVLPEEFVGVESWGTWNGNDPVPYVPLACAQFQLQIIGHDDKLDPFACHHLVAVAAALDDLNRGTST